MTLELLSISAVKLQTSFHHCLVKFHQLQAKYQPEVVHLVAWCTMAANINTIHDTPLYLPSSLPPGILNECSKQLILMEMELRIGQCCNALIQLCTKLNAQTHLLKYKYIHVWHQASNTHSCNLLNGINLTIVRATLNPPSRPSI